MQKIEVFALICNVVAKIWLHAKSMVSFVKGGSKLMKRDLSILSEYVRISTPDRDRLAELVVRAKGPELSMSQFAKKVWG